MKKIAFALLVVLPLLSNAQSFWSQIIDDQEFNKSLVTSKGLLNDSIILIGGYVSTSSCPYHQLFAYNYKGERLWNKWGYFDLIATDSNYIYTAGYTPIDDIIGMEQIVVVKYDINGNSIATIGFPEVPHNGFFEFNPVSIDFATDGTVLVASSNKVVKTNIGFTTIYEIALNPSFDIKNIKSVSPSTYFIQTEKSLYKADSSMVLTDSISFSSPIKRMLIDKKTIFSLFSNYLVTLDPNLNIIDTLAISLNDQFADFEIYQHQVYIKTNQSAQIELIQVREQDENDTLIFDLPWQNNQFIVSSDNFIFIGDSPSGQIAVCNFIDPQWGNIEANLPDMEMSDFNIDNLVYQYENPLYPEVITGYGFDADFIVKNNGNQTINSLLIYGYLNGGMNCSHNILCRRRDNLSIEPGQSETIQITGISNYGLYKTLCFECLAPNAQLEINTDNNSLCKTFDGIGISGLNINDIHIYPNPVEDFIQIDNQMGNEFDMSLCDMNGKTLRQMKVVKGHNRISLNDVKSGVYIIQITSKKQLYKRLIIKH